MDKKYLEIVMKDNSTPEMLVYGYIGTGDGCISSADFTTQLKNLESKYGNINIRINSGGGNVFEGLTIFNAIKNSTANIDTYIDGLAASMGSIIALAGNKIYMSKVARFMTHKPSAMTMGNSTEMRDSAAMLDSLETTMSDIYAKRTGLTPAAAMAAYLTDKDVWLDAKTALNAKLIDGIYDGDSVDIPTGLTDQKAIWNLFDKQFKNSINNMETISAASRTALNITGVADTATIDAAINRLSVEAAKVPNLEARLNTATLAKEKAENELNAFKAETGKTEITGMLATAVTEGRITKATSAIYAADYATNPEGLKKLLGSLPRYESLTGKIEEGGDTVAAEIKELAAMSYEDLDKKSKLERYKAISPDGFREKFKNKYGKYPKA